MSVGKLRQVGISIALGSCLALGCSSEKSETSETLEESAGAQSETPAGAQSEQPAAGAAAPVLRADDPNQLPNFDALPTVELPGNFPEDVPRYPGARAVKATPDPEGANNWVAQFSTPDDLEKIYANLVDALAAQGWMTERADAPGSIRLFANKGNRNVTYGIESIQDKTVLNLIIMEAN